MTTYELTSIADGEHNGDGLVEVGEESSTLLVPERELDMGNGV